MLNRILIATILGSSMVFLDASVANIILPRLQEAFHRSLLDLQWVVTAYGVTLSAFLLLGGALGDRYGRRRVFLTGLGTFALASVACTVSRSFWGLIAARSVQGVGGALLAPESLAILNATFPTDRRSRAIGAWSAASALTGVIGPPLGGWVTQMWSWRAVFLINAPVALLTVYFARKSIPLNCSETGSARFDFLGSLLGALGLGALIYGMTQGLLWTAFGLGALGLFLFYESRALNPVLPLSVFKNRVFSHINLMTLFLYGSFAMVLFFLPSHLILVEHYSPAQAGLALTPSGAMIALLARPVGGWMRSLGTETFLLGGAALVTMGYVILAIAGPERSYLASLFPGLLFLGTGFGFTVTPLTSKALSSLGDEESGLASGVNNAVARVAGVLGVTVAAGLLTMSFRAHVPQGSKMRSMDPMMAMPASAPAEMKESFMAARLASYRELLWWSAALSVLAGLSVLALRKDSGPAIGVAREAHRKAS